MSHEDAKMVMGAYILAARDFPPWAVAEACERFVGGRVEGHNPAFAPSAAQVCALAHQITDTFQRERFKLQKALERSVEEVAA